MDNQKESVINAEEIEILLNNLSVITENLANADEELFFNLLSDFDDIYFALLEAHYLLDTEQKKIKHSLLNKKDNFINIRIDEINRLIDNIPSELNNQEISVTQQVSEILDNLNNLSVLNKRLNKYMKYQTAFLQKNNHIILNI